MDTSGKRDDKLPCHLTPRQDTPENARQVMHMTREVSRPESPIV